MRTLRAAEPADTDLHRCGWGGETMTPRRERLLPQEAPATPVGDRQDVLVVDDDQDLRDSMAELVREAGYRVAVAADGREALALLERGPLPTLVLLDIRMPVMDGLRSEERRVG